MHARITNCHNVHLHPPYNSQPFHCKQLPIHFFGEHGNQELGPFILENVCPQVKLNMRLQDGVPPHFN